MPGLTPGLTQTKGGQLWQNCGKCPRPSQIRPIRTDFATSVTKGTHSLHPAGRSLCDQGVPAWSSGRGPGLPDRAICGPVGEVMVRMKGLEPSRELPHSDLNAARLPIPPHPHDLAWWRLFIEGFREWEEQISARFSFSRSPPLWPRKAPARRPHRGHARAAFPSQGVVLAEAGTVAGATSGSRGGALALPATAAAARSISVILSA